MAIGTAEAKLKEKRKSEEAFAAADYRESPLIYSIFHSVNRALLQLLLPSVEGCWQPKPPLMERFIFALAALRCIYRVIFNLLQL